MSVTTAVPTVEQICDAANRPLACIIYSSHRPERTEFMTPNEWNQQVGFIVYPKGASIARHVHKAIARRITGTAEVLVVRKGRCEVELYAEDGEFAAKRELGAGAVLVLIAGGHGFRMLEDTVLLEIKQGPYTGLAEKEYF